MGVQISSGEGGWKSGGRLFGTQEYDPFALRY